jgi:hypothetical protein
MLHNGGRVARADHIGAAWIGVGRGVPAQLPAFAVQATGRRGGFAAGCSLRLIVGYAAPAISSSATRPLARGLRPAEGPAFTARSDAA